MEKGKSDNSSQILDAILNNLRKCHLKITEPRKAILRALLVEHGPFTAEELHKKITKKVCDLATVYRCLASLEKADFVRRCEFGDGSARYELSQKEHDLHHHHVICKECKKVEVLDDCRLDDIDRFARRRGFADISHALEFFGTCPDCQAS